MHFHIIIPVHNRFEHTHRCLVSLKNQTYKKFSVYIVDDGSTDNTSELIKRDFSKFIDLRIIAGDGNLWWGGAIRKGVLSVHPAMGDGDIIVTLNNDVIVPENFLATAVCNLKMHPKSMLGAISIDARDGITISQTGWQMKCWALALTRRVWWPGRLEDREPKESYIDVDFLPGTATFIPKIIIDIAGAIDSDNFPHYHGDSEYSHRVKKYGFKVVLCRNLMVYHDLLATGVASNVRKYLTILDAIKSFFIRRSSNCLLYRWRFAVISAPRGSVFLFFFFDTLKALIRTFGSCILGPRVDLLKKMYN